MNNMLAFWFVSILFVITPGADWAYAISSGMQKKGVFPAVSGLLLGHIAALLLVATGLGLIIHNHPHVLFVISLIGALYLLWIGICIFRNPAQISADQQISSISKRQWTLKGLCVSGLNPKVFLLFFMMLPQFVSVTSSHPTQQIFTLGLIHMVNCTIIYFLVGFGSQILLKARPEAALWISRISGSLVILISIILIFEQFLSLKNTFSNIL